MDYIVVAVCAFAAGAACIVFVSEAKRKKLEKDAQTVREAKQFASLFAKECDEEKTRLNAAQNEFEIQQKALNQRFVSFTELQDENAILKRDLRNLAVQVRKLQLDRLKARLAEAEAKSQRAISQAQLTKSGHVYVISNIGSFGEGVFKVGMTRRLEPFDRVKELGDASVPFPFDVHAMISCNDAPSLENALHRTLHKTRINKINPRKEFFKADIETIFQIVKEHHGEVEYMVDAEAIQYRQCISMSDEDQEFIESVYDDLEEENEVAVDEA